MRPVNDVQAVVIHVSGHSALCQASDGVPYRLMCDDFWGITLLSSGSALPELSQETRTILQQVGIDPDTLEERESYRQLALADGFGPE